MGVYIPNIDLMKLSKVRATPTRSVLDFLQGFNLIEIDLEKDIPTIWYNRQTGQFEPKGTKQEVYKRIYKLQNGGRSVDDNTIKANK